MVVCSELSYYTTWATARCCAARKSFEQPKPRKRFFFYGSGLCKSVSIVGKFEGERAFQVAARKAAAVLAASARTEVAGGMGADEAVAAAITGAAAAYSEVDGAAVVAVAAAEARTGEISMAKLEK
jgi:hypothetical protein